MFDETSKTFDRAQPEDARHCNPERVFGHTGLPPEKMASTLPNFDQGQPAAGCDRRPNHLCKWRDIGQAIASVDHAVERKPYELLVQWDADGNLLGAHVQWSNVVTNDDGSKQVYPTTVEPVALTGEDKGVPIADVLNEAQSKPIRPALSNCDL
jgi:hypothetical protein